ncbi:hypothetical protein EC01288_4545, partial [Escherichia coli 0.1288]
PRTRGFSIPCSTD